jgi:ABC-type transporter Mla subunit MlaD
MFKFLRRKKGKGMSPFKAGVIFLVILGVATFFGFTKYNPFYSPYIVTAYFESSNQLKTGYSFVRVAGVNVGQVSSVEVLPDGTAKVEMEIQKIGWPIHEDAEIKIRPRIFLEGNFFIDVHPGSPASPILPEDGSAVIPINQTAVPVQFGQLLTTLQGDTRENLRTLLAEFSINALKGDGAKGFNRSIPYMAPAYRSTSLANTATLGSEPHDLSDGVLRGQKETFEALTTDEESLKDLITNFNITANAFAREDDELETDIVALRDLLRSAPEALRSINNVLPSLRAFARDATPGVRSTPEMIDATTPFLREARQLLSERELKGLARDLRQTVPDLARLNRSQMPLLEQQSLFASCMNEVFLPFVETPIPDPDFPEHDGRLVREDAGSALTGLSGESRTGDANGQAFRVMGRSGGQQAIATGEDGEELLMSLPSDNTGVRPARDEEKGRPDFRPRVPCETQEPPNMNAPKGQVGESEGLPSANDILNGRNGDRVRELAERRLRRLFGQDPNSRGIVPFAGPEGD